MRMGMRARMRILQWLYLFNNIDYSNRTICIDHPPSRIGVRDLLIIKLHHKIRSTSICAREALDFIYIKDVT